MSESYGLLADEEAFSAVGRALSAMLGAGDERVEFRASVTIPVSALKVRVYQEVVTYFGDDVLIDK